MSGTSAFDGGEVGHGGYRPLFTAMQWQELEHQARIYKYMVAGLSVPLDLVVPIRQSLEALSARFFSYPSLGCFSYYGKKFDPEPGRCRRTDGKKWRCSKEAHPDSKYCERHMHRGRNRSRKPVESSQNTSDTLSTTTSQVTSTNYLISSGGSFQNIPLYSVAVSKSSHLGGNMNEPICSEFRCTPVLNPEADGLSSNTGTGTWRLVPSQVNSTNFLKRRSDDSYLLNPNSFQENMTTHHGFEPVIGTTTACKRRREQNCLLSSEIGSPKHEQQQHSVQPFFSKWPTIKESCFGLDGDDDESNKNVFSSTRLSISIPRSSSDFP